MSWIFKRGSEPTLDEVFEKVYQLLRDEDLQNQKLPEGLKEEINWSASVDEVPGAWGEFGRDLNNPIPVNGPLGEILYLSSVKLENGQPVAFQRLGSVGKIDIFETVSFDGRDWDLLHLSMYYPRKSTHTPKRFRFVGKDRGNSWIRGVNDFAAQFPAGILQRTLEYTERRFGWSIADPGMKVFDGATWSRPERHLTYLKQLQFAGRLEGR